MITRLPDSSHIMPGTSQDMEIVSKMGPMIVVGLLMPRVLRKNPPTESALSREDKATQRVASS
jgi:hypothetical protein